LPLSVSPVYIPDHIAEETEDYRIAEDTILFTMTGTKGKRDYFYTCRIKEENLPGCKLYLNQPASSIVRKKGSCKIRS
ncbi:MAG: hypothetical protein PUK39_05150, partial [Clostridiales bacterium]|nr:hypothetical protein [Clostridiales bacterium]